MILEANTEIFPIEGRDAMADVQMVKRVARWVGFILFALVAILALAYGQDAYAEEEKSETPVVTNGNGWCNAISFQKTRVKISRGRTEKFTVRATCPQSIDPKAVTFPEGTSGVFAVRPDKGIQFTLAVSFQAGEDWDNRNGVLRGPEAAIEYAPQGGEAQTIVVIELKGRKPKEVRYKFTD